jgi:hypothetical protein
LLTPAADLGADAAVLVVGRMLVALLRARSTRDRARLGFRPEDADLRFGPPDEDSPRGLAGVGAVEAESNAADHLGHVRFGEVGIGATRARRRAVDALLDATQQPVTIEGGGTWMSSEHVSNGHVLSLQVERSNQAEGYARNGGNERRLGE